MSYTLAEAAVATGTNKTTILRAIKSGRISGTKDPFGTWRVEIAELHRVYPPTAPAATSTDATPRDAPPLITVDIEAHQRAALAEQRILSELRALLDDMRGQRDKWQAMAEARGIATAEIRAVFG